MYASPIHEILATTANLWLSRPPQPRLPDAGQAVLTAREQRAIRGPVAGFRRPFSLATHEMVKPACTCARCAGRFLRRTTAARLEQPA